MLISLEESSEIDAESIVERISDTFAREAESDVAKKSLTMSVTTALAKSENDDESVDERALLKIDRSARSDATIDSKAALVWIAVRTTASEIENESLVDTRKATTPLALSVIEEASTPDRTLAMILVVASLVKNASVASLILVRTLRVALSLVDIELLVDRVSVTIL
jgi:hypothetical protein